MKVNDLQPVACTNFKLRQLLRSVSRLYDTHISQAGLKGSQFSLLSFVLRLGPISPSDLAARMGMDASTLSRNLRPLIDKAWLLQGPGADARGRLVEITAVGRTKHGEARKHWQAAQQSLNQRLGQDLALRLNELLDQSQQQLLDASSDRT